MHKYLNAIGFHDIASEREWYQILLESEKNFSGYDRIALDEHTDLCELRREYGNGIGISSYGFIDENNEAFRRECYFPYFSGSGVSSYADIAVEQKTFSPTYVGVCEDVKLGCSIIFHIQNGIHKRSHSRRSEQKFNLCNIFRACLKWENFASGHKGYRRCGQESGRAPQPDDAHERSKGRESRCH